MAFACVYYPRSNPGGKGSLTTSWTGFILDAQGQIPYSPSPKKEVLITSPHLKRLFDEYDMERGFVQVLLIT